MEILKNDMTKEEIQFVVELLLDLPHGELGKLTTPTLIKMHNNINKNLMAFNILEDKYRALVNQGTYKPLAKERKRPQRKPRKGAK